MMNEEVGLALKPNTEMLPTVMREAQEVQAMVISARRFPRDQKQAFNRILDACKRPTLAEKAMYAYPRGGQTVTGPSIRLAETCAQNWGNIQAGVREIDREPGFSVAEAYCWDLETNTRFAMTFRVPHVRETKKGNVELTSDRDIYELVANMGARRMRKCILNVIPGDIIEAACQECDKTLGTLGEKKEKVTELIGLFNKHKVTRENVERRIGKRIEAITGPEFVQLRKIYQSLEDGASTKADWFEDVLDPKKIMSYQEMDPGQQVHILAAKRAEVIKDFSAVCKEVEAAGGVPGEILKVSHEQLEGANTSTYENCSDVLRDWLKKNPKLNQEGGGMSTEPKSKNEFRTDQGAVKEPLPKVYAMIDKYLADPETPQAIGEILAKLAATQLLEMDHLDLPQTVRLAKGGDMTRLKAFALAHGIA